MQHKFPYVFIALTNCNMIFLRVPVSTDKQDTYVQMYTCLSEEKAEIKDRHQSRYRYTDISLSLHPHFYISSYMLVIYATIWPLFRRSPIGSVYSLFGRPLSIQYIHIHHYTSFVNILIFSTQKQHISKLSQHSIFNSRN